MITVDAQKCITVTYSKIVQEDKLAKWFASAAQRDEEARKKREEKAKLKEEEDRLKAFDAETFAKQSEEIREDVRS